MSSNVRSFEYLVDSLHAARITNDIQKIIWNHKLGREYSEENCRYLITLLSNCGYVWEGKQPSRIVSLTADRGGNTWLSADPGANTWSFEFDSMPGIVFRVSITLSAKEFIQCVGDIRYSASAAMSGYRKRFQASVSFLFGANYESLDVNRQVAEIVQQTADELGMVFICGKCNKPGRLRCNADPRSPHGSFSIAHGRGTMHGRTTTFPRLLAEHIPKPDKKKEE